MLRNIRVGTMLAALLAAAALAGAPLASAAPLADSAILFIGDGMGPLHIELTRVALGGEPLAMEKMPFSGTVTTHSANRAVTDSAAAGTALATGRKTNNGMVGVSPDGKPLVNLLDRARAAHKNTGIATTDSLYGATPASFAAHVSGRGEREKIAEQLAASRVQVMLGFGKDAFLPKSAGGSREDGKDLVAEMRDAGYQVAFTRTEMSEVKKRQLVGLFGGEEEPTLAEMVEAAIARLSPNGEGFLLVVEGARIDWRAHDSDPAGVIVETRALAEAVAVALDYARAKGRTLVVVTADHETGGLGITSPARLPALRGVQCSSGEIARRLAGDRSDVREVVAACTGMSDLTEAEVARIRADKDAAAAIAAVLSARAGVTWRTTGHTDTPVRVSAFGPGADRFTGSMDNTEIPGRIAIVLGMEALPG